MSRLRSSCVIAVAALQACSCVDTEETNAPHGFVNDGPIGPATVFVRAAGEGGFELVAKDIDALYGVAFRIRFDPAVLRFQELTPSDVWPEASLALGEEAEAGLLVGVLGARGPFPGLSPGEVVLGTLAFERRGAGSSPLAFQAERSGVVGTDGRRRSGVSFIGGTIR